MGACCATPSPEIGLEATFKVDLRNYNGVSLEWRTSPSSSAPIEGSPEFKDWLRVQSATDGEVVTAVVFSDDWISQSVQGWPGQPGTIYMPRTIIGIGVLKWAREPYSIRLDAFANSLLRNKLAYVSSYSENYLESISPGAEMVHHNQIVAGSVLQCPPPCGQWIRIESDKWLPVFVQGKQVVYDTAGMDVDGDGVADIFAVDVDGDGEADKVINREEILATAMMKPTTISLTDLPLHKPTKDDLKRFKALLREFNIRPGGSRGDLRCGNKLSQKDFDRFCDELQSIFPGVSVSQFCDGGTLLNEVITTPTTRQEMIFAYETRSTQDEDAQIQKVLGPSSPKALPIDVVPEKFPDLDTSEDESRRTPKKELQRSQTEPAKELNRSKTEV